MQDYSVTHLQGIGYFQLIFYGSLEQKAYTITYNPPGKLSDGAALNWAIEHLAHDTPAFEYLEVKVQRIHGYGE